MRINKTRSWFVEKINKLLAKLIKKKERRNKYMELEGGHNYWYRFYKIKYYKWLVKLQHLYFISYFKNVLLFWYRIIHVQLADLFEHIFEAMLAIQVHDYHGFLNCFFYQYDLYVYT